MRVGMKHAVGFGLTVVPGLLVATASAQAQDPAPEPVQCEVQVTDAVPISEKPVVVEATYSPTLGEALAAVLQEESGAQLVFAEMGTAAQSLLLTVNTSHALPGEWTLSLTGERGLCIGTFTVAAAQQAAAP